MVRFKPEFLWKKKKTKQIQYNRILLISLCVNLVSWRISFMSTVGQFVYITICSFTLLIAPCSILNILCFLTSHSLVSVGTIWRHVLLFLCLPGELYELGCRGHFSSFYYAVVYSISNRQSILTCPEFKSTSDRLRRKLYGWLGYYQHDNRIKARLLTESSICLKASSISSSVSSPFCSSPSKESRG